MTLFRFIIQSLKYYKKQHFALFLGTIISTAVLTGALIVGDSVKLSLKSLVDSRLGNIRYSMHAGDRFFTNELGPRLGSNLDVKTSSILLLEGIAINQESNDRINKTQVVAIDSTFWDFSDKENRIIKSDEAILSENTAEKLQVKEGDFFLLRVENASKIPLNAPFAQEENPTVSFRLQVKEIIGDKDLARFSLRSNQNSPFNVFISRANLANRLELEDLSNVLLVAGSEDLDLNKLNETLHDVWTIQDAGLSIRKLESTNEMELLSDRIFIDNPISELADNMVVEKNKVLTYLVNSLKSKDKETPYSFVSAIKPEYLNTVLADDEIIINRWLADDLGIRPKDTLRLEYFVIGPLRTLAVKNKTFTVKSILETKHERVNTNLMPLFPGLADAGHCSEWETGIPIDLDKIRDKDEDYWDDFKGTPKALITQKAGQDLWQNKFGNFTSIRFHLDDITQEELEKEIQTKLQPKDLNLSFIPVYEQGMKASENGVDFGELFLSLSFFVIVAGILLTVLIYTLGTESRMQEIGTLSGLGFTKKIIIRIRMVEAFVISVFGGIVGAFVGILYNAVMIHALNSVWQGAVHTNNLKVFVETQTILIGAGIGIFLAFVVIAIVIRKKLKQPIAALVKSKNHALKHKTSNKFWNFLPAISLSLALILVLYSVFSSISENAMFFMGSGTLFMIGAIALLNNWFRAKENQETGVLSNNILAFKNLGRNKNRSISTIILLALGVFSIILTGANKKTFYGEEDRNSSGTGGFLYWVESTLPILYDMNSKEGKINLNLEDEPVLENAIFAQFHRLDGDDASCLNLNQVEQPGILSVPYKLFKQEKSFSFDNLLPQIDPNNPWDELDKIYGENIYPAFADQTIITWGLIKTIGDTLFYKGESGEEIKFVLAGGLSASVFQGNLLISDEVFSKHFPSVSGSRTMMIDANKAEAAEIETLLKSSLRDYGIEITQTNEKLAEFNTVTNTYLSVFMALGGLGVIIGTFGLGILLLRNMLERKNEIAILKAVGFTKKQLFQLIFTENLVLLVSGILIGTIAAFIGIFPSIISASFKVPIGFILVLISAIFSSGLIWIYFPARSVIKGILMDDLREE